MLHHDSIPVWMLADSLLAILMIAVLAGAAAIPMENSESESPSPSGDNPAALQCQLADATTDAMNTRQENERLRQIVQQLTEQQTALELNNAGLRHELLAGKSSAATLQLQLQALTQAAAGERGIRQDLIGFQGDMRRTVFLIDVSGSMGHDTEQPYPRANWRPGENAWTNVQRKVSEYLEFLPVESFRIVCFNSELAEFPVTNGAWSHDRQAALAFLDGVQPEGLTGTEAALTAAAACSPTSIVLFTDGQPTRSITSTSPAGEETQVTIADIEQQQHILQMAESGALACPVNVIALNNYAGSAGATDSSSPPERSLLLFLQELAGRTGGSFLGY